MFALALFIAAEPTSYPVFEETIDESRLVVLCDPRQFRFSVRAQADEASVDRSYPRRTVIAPSGLMAPLPGYRDLAEVMGPLVRYERCGPYTMRLEGDAYNLYVQGESGAYDPFINVRVLGGPKRVYPDVGSGGVRFTECDRSLPRAAGCPDGYAVRLDGSYDPVRKKLILVETTTSNVESEDKSERTTMRRWEEDADWSLWKTD